MGVRSIRFYDLPAVHRIEANQDSHVLWPTSLDEQRSAAYLAVASAWQDVNQTLFTFVLREKREVLGVAQASARPGRDAWDLLRVALVPADPEDRERAADALIERLLEAVGSRGALRTFARAATGSEGQAMLSRQGFRQYTTQSTLACDRLDIAPAPLPEHLEFRPRRAVDAWGIFQLYCSVAPPQVRHAEGLSSKRWSRDSRLAQALPARWLRVREVVLTDEGLVVGWVRLTPIKGHAAQRLQILLHPRAHAALPALLAHAAVALEARLDHYTICHVREYETAILDGLCAAGFSSVGEHALLVRHAAVRVTERQLLIAAVRAQSLGIDVSRYQRPAVEMPVLRRASSGTPAPRIPPLAKLIVELPLHDRTRTN